MKLFRGSHEQEILRQQRQERKALEYKHRVERRALAKILKAEGKYYQASVIKALTRAGVCFRYPKNRKDIWSRGVQEVRILSVAAGPDTVYLRVNTRPGRLPINVALADLMDARILDTLSATCEHPVWYKYEPEIGFWYCVDRNRGYKGIPREVAYDDARSYMPASAAPLAFPLGAGENGQMLHTDLATAPHLLIAGSTGGGKSTFLNNIIITLAERNEPTNLQIYMIDLKRVELTFYEGLPHLSAPVITTPLMAMDIIKSLLDEVHRRMSIFQGVCRDIRGWNARRKFDRLPYVVLFIDELAELMLNRQAIPGGWERYRAKYEEDRYRLYLDDDGHIQMVELTDEEIEATRPRKPPTVAELGETLLARLAATSRAAGIHIVAATQRPSVDVITGYIKQSFSTRAAFGTADDATSRTIIETAEAKGLPTGRLIFVKGKDHIEVQAPLVTDAMVEKRMRDLREVPPRPDRYQQAADTLFRLALDNYGGEFSLARLYEEVKAKDLDISKGLIERIGREFEGQTIEIDGLAYILMPSEIKQGGRTARHLTPCLLNSQSPNLDINGKGDALNVHDFIGNAIEPGAD